MRVASGLMHPSAMAQQKRYLLREVMDLTVRYGMAIGSQQYAYQQGVYMEALIEKIMQLRDVHMRYSRAWMLWDTERLHWQQKLDTWKASTEEIKE